MTKFLRFIGTTLGITVVVLVLLASTEPPASFHAKSWLGVVNRWLFDSGWEEEIVQSNLLLTKTSLTDESLALGVMCGLEQRTLAVILFSDPSRGQISSDIKLSFDEGPYFNEKWVARPEKSALIVGGDSAYVLLRRMLTSNVLRISIDGRGIVQDDFKFYLEDLRTHEQSLRRYCQWEG